MQHIQNFEPMFYSGVMQAGMESRGSGSAPIFSATRSFGVILAPSWEPAPGSQLPDFRKKLEKKKSQKIEKNAKALDRWGARAIHGHLPESICPKPVHPKLFFANGQML